MLYRIHYQPIGKSDKKHNNKEDKSKYLIDVEVGKFNRTLSMRIISNKEAFLLHHTIILFRMNHFGAAHWWGGGGGGGGGNCPLFKTYHTYRTMMKLGTVIPYLKKIQKKKKKITRHITWVLLTSAFFSPGISNISYFKKYRYRLHFNT